ncbi:uncharacterized protein LOC127262555 [Andrographis paniculata]|uniref:uncharacterized protein LOC127262555 n=1 Tax=Andrographis paniculata TaxID=175694 RepID=UPI0021E8486F|nr:uncharacterized protein LOC127262555 [Andrographis paniculata]
MYRHSPSRNQRSKRIKVKHILQICLLVAVCFWLLYQVKHSHDKRKEFSGSDGRGLIQRDGSSDRVKFGRKDIQGGVKGSFAKNVNHDEPEEEEEDEGTREEAKENKSEDDVLGGKKIGEHEDEATEGGDDEVDVHELERTDDEREEDLEDRFENDTHETDSINAHGQGEKEAREEHYKADDASSAVAHEGLMSTTENENESREKSTDNPHNILEEGKNDNESEGEERKDSELGAAGMARDETMDGILDNLENDTSTNNTVTEGFDEHLASNSTPEVAMDNPSQNLTESKSELDHDPETLTNNTSSEDSDLKVTDSSHTNDSIVSADGAGVGSNSTDSIELKNADLHSEESSISSNNDTQSASETIDKTGTFKQARTDGSPPKKKDEIEAENSDVNSSTDGSTESTPVENHLDDLHGTIDVSDTSNTLEENDVRMDLDTLPKLETEGTNSRDVAAE